MLYSPKIHSLPHCFFCNFTDWIITYFSDIDECQSTELNDCDSNAYCVVYPNSISYSCQCKDSFSGDGFSCKQQGTWWYFYLGELYKSKKALEGNRKVHGGFFYLEELYKSKKALEGNSKVHGGFFYLGELYKSKKLWRATARYTVVFFI